MKHTKKGKRARLLCAVLAALLLLAVPAVGCTGTGGGDASGTETGDTDTGGGTPTGTATESITATETQTETATEDTRIEMDIYGNGCNTNMLVGFDEQGHLVDAVSAPRENKQVGMFYFIWLGQHGAQEIYDISKIRPEYGDEVTFHKDVPGISPANNFHWWGEPLYGYYNSGDRWVIRRHLELLTDAGVDFLVFDTTNANTYDNIAKRIMKVIEELRAEGWNCPQVAYYTHSYAIQTMTNLYNNIYKAEVCPNAWYRVDGKPLIIGYMDPKLDKAEAESRGDTSYNPSAPSQEMQDFFYFREARWPYERAKSNSWPYTDWSWPQKLNGDMISVSIATHPGVPFSFSLTHEGWMNWGRGYNPRTKVNVHEDIMKGTFYDFQWDTVYKRDPNFVFVTGWNEWVSIKSAYGGEYMYCDNVDMEYSRDAEPMLGGYEDAYFIQTIRNIRQYKYQPITGYVAKTVRKTVDIGGAASQWEDVNAVYRRVGTDDGSRDSVGGATSVSYRNDAVRNNILEVRLTNDAENLYVMIRTENDIVTVEDTGWMNLFVGCGRPATGKGWEGYEYAVNRSRTDGRATVEAMNADGTGTRIGEVSYTVQGNVMQIAIPRALIGADGMGDIYFKVADGVENPAEIMSYYASGRSLPMGRLSYLYQFGQD